MKTLYIVRHAKAEGQPFESRLTEEGRRQAVELAGFFKDRPVDFIYSSPFIRALETVGPLAESKGLDVSADSRLGERVLSSLYFLMTGRLSSCRALMISDCALKTEKPRKRGWQGLHLS
ncbi:histidine phosphatase family protein [Bacillus infantis]|uniref:histidine phosphatase family protein n=1 Tax=Bacillus infantis TaxID=324767 RepID=UPI003CF36758